MRAGEVRPLLLIDGGDRLDAALSHLPRDDVPVALTQLLFHLSMRSRKPSAGDQPNGSLALAVGSIGGVVAFCQFADGIELLHDGALVFGVEGEWHLVGRR